MSRRKKVEEKPTQRVFKPGLTPEEVEDQCIAAAYELAAQRILDGTASSQEIVHFLRAGSRKEVLERRVLELEADLKRAKTSAIESSAELQSDIANALHMFKVYSGNSGNTNES